MHVLCLYRGGVCRSWWKAACVGGRSRLCSFSPRVCRVAGRRVLSGSVQFRPAIDFKYIRDNEEMLVKNAEER
jgi:hypothetical protein